MLLASNQLKKNMKEQLLYYINSHRHFGSLTEHATTIGERCEDGYPKSPLGTNGRFRIVEQYYAPRSVSRYCSDLRNDGYDLPLLKPLPEPVEGTDMFIA